MAAGKRRRKRKWTWRGLKSFCKLLIDFKKKKKQTQNPGILKSAVAEVKNSPMSHMNKSPSVRNPIIYWANGRSGNFSYLM